MPFMRISPGPLYAKKGTPKEREQRRFQQLADDILAQVLPSSSRPERRLRRRPDDTESTQAQATVAPSPDKTIHPDENSSRTEGQECSRRICSTTTATKYNAGKSWAAR